MYQRLFFSFSPHTCRKVKAFSCARISIQWLGIDSWHSTFFHNTASYELRMKSMLCKTSRKKFFSLNYEKNYVVLFFLCNGRNGKTVLFRCVIMARNRACTYSEKRRIKFMFCWYLFSFFFYTLSNFIISELISVNFWIFKLIKIIIFF